MPTRLSELLRNSQLSEGIGETWTDGRTPGHLRPFGGTLLERTAYLRPSEQVLILALVRTELTNKNL